MDSNKDEANRCIDLAVQFGSQGNRDKAIKFLLKAEKLYSTPRAKKLLADLLNSTNDSSQNNEPRKRTNVKKDESTKQSEETTSSSSSEFTKEQLQHVQRIKKCKDYYEILSVSKEATDTEIKKSYKKLALQLHPDKNKAPGAAEAFKAIGNAVAILTNPEKRKQYDLYGSNEERSTYQRSHHHHYQEYTRGFEADMTAEELFNMFFGAGFPSHSSNVYMRRNGRWHRAAADDEGSASGNPNGAAVIVQLLPILFLIVLSMLSSLFISDPVYSLQPNSKYQIARHTTRFNVPYYVKDNFRLEYQGSLSRLEQNIEEEYLNMLRSNCYKEKNHKDMMMWRAQNMNDKDLYKKAQSMSMPACDEFMRLQKKPY